MSPEQIRQAQQVHGLGPHLAADLVVVTADLADPDPRCRILLVRRGRAPYPGWWALPGGFVNANEDLEDAARRELAEETGLDDLSHARIEPLCTLGHPDRDPRSRVVSAVFLALLSSQHRAVPTAGDDAAAAAWLPIDSSGTPLDDHLRRVHLAFDHDEALAHAWQRLQTLARFSSAPLCLLPTPFSTAQLARLYALLGCPGPAETLLRWLERQGWIQPAGADGWVTRRAATEPLWVPAPWTLL